LALGIAAAAGARRDDSIIEAARRAFDGYQDALFAADRQRLREALSAKSRELVPEIPFERVREKARLRVVDAVARPPQVLVAVEDPNQGGKECTFVLVREDGELRVDLVATTAYNHEERPAEQPGPRIAPRELSPDELARIRSLEPESFR
jgi:hypothetical protein